ncbi:hypothetical protein KY337_00290 [Candidatus Woesearchaeota archaeon]|nr:hypothetical protein [Candidatus Woesearchaeota archaeon]
MTKRGQLTIYIIVGIIILLVIGLIFFFRVTEGPELTQQQILDSTKANIESYVRSCLIDEGTYALLVLGYQGGYIFEPGFGTMDYEGFAVPYDYYIGYNMLPSVRELEQLQMNDFLETSIGLCVDDLNAFREVVDIQTDDLRVNTSIGFDEVTITLDYPTTITVGDSFTEISSYSESFDVRLGNIVGVADQVIQRIVEDPNWIDLTFLDEQALRVQVTPYTATESMYFITDSESILAGRPYVFVFAAKYTDNTPPYIYPIPDFTVKKGEQFQYFVDAVDFDGDNVTYTDDSDLFDITAEGEISFTPVEEGISFITITVEDELGFTDEAEFFIEVEG